ncbi:MAG: NACHT domain-containing protein, partial [Cyanobacteria bacterium J06629_19]
MLDPLTFAGISAGTKVLVDTVLVPLAKEAGGDFYKDFLKDNASKALYEKVPALLKKVIDRSHKDFLDLFREELEYCDLPGTLVKHEFAAPLKQLLQDPDVKQFLGKALDFETKKLDGNFLQDKWARLHVSTLPKEFDWEQLTKNYLRKVKGLIREDAELSRQLELNYQERVRENTEELVGVKVGFDLGQYQESLKEKFGSLSLDSLDTTGAAYDNLRLWKIFVAQDVRECAEFAPQMYELPKERLLELQKAGEIDSLLSLDTLEQQRKSYAEKPIESVRGVVGLGAARSVERAVILGDPGSGKSTLLRAIALDWAEKSLAALKNEPIPILIELRLYAQDKDAGVCNSFLEYLHKGNTACRLNQLALDELLKSGKAVALFDGVDEVFDPNLREAVVTDIHRFSNSYPQVQMVVTSRWLGYKAETLRKADFQHYMLQDLNAEQIEDFLARWHRLTFTAAQEEDKKRKQARLQKAITESKAIRELAGNPLLLTMMAILNRNQELPRDRARLYERASEVLLYQWDVEVKLHEQEELKNWQIDVRDKQAMLRKVAHHMQANDDGLSGNVISREDLERILTEYLKTLEVSRARAVAKVMIEQLRERNFILCYLGADNYAFVHRTFLEYFCASEFVHQFEKEKVLQQEDLEALHSDHFQDESWDEVLRLMAGMIEPRFVGNIVQHLIIQEVDSNNFLDDSLRFRPSGFEQGFVSRGAIGHLLLAADCVAEVRTHSELGPPAQKLLAELKKKQEREYPYYLEQDAALAITDAIAVHWKNAPQTLPWLEQCVESRDGASYFPESALRSISSYWAAKSSTLPWLKSRAQEDDNWAVRSAAVQELAKGWKDDPDTL